MKPKRRLIHKADNQGNILCRAFGKGRTSIFWNQVNCKPCFMVEGGECQTATEPYSAEFIKTAWDNILVGHKKHNPIGTENGNVTNLQH